MSRRLITLSLAAFAFAVPVGAAHATTFEGSCELSGEFAFTGGSYSIAGDEFDAGCSGNLNGTDSGYLVRYTSAGPISGGCGGGFLGAGTGKLEFYRVNVAVGPPQAPQFVDTLDVVYETGAMGADGRVARVLSGAAGGLAVEAGRVHHCGASGARYAGQFDTLGLSD